MPPEKLVALYKNRPEWKDVKPIYNSEAEEGVIKISTSEEFIDAFAYLRAILTANEMSERALELTKSCVLLNAANYSVWQYRRNILKALNKDIKEELIFCEESTNDNPKNYQVWHHRRMLIEICEDFSEELSFTENMLIDDSKNYHAWQYRQWVIQRFNLFSPKEMEFSTNSILEDMRNNSAWNYRYFIGSNLSDAFKNKEFVDKEVDILVNFGISSRKDVEDFCIGLLRQNPRCESVHLRNFIVDCLIEKIENKSDVEENTQFAHDVLNELEKLDPIRFKYWRYRHLYVDNISSFN